jgi:hypothetical protein
MFNSAGEFTGLTAQAAFQINEDLFHQIHPLSATTAGMFYCTGTNKITSVFNAGPYFLLDGQARLKSFCCFALYAYLINSTKAINLPSLNNNL